MPPGAPENLRRVLRLLVLTQVVGMLCLVGGVVWIMLAVAHNASAAVQFCTGSACGRESYVPAVVLAALGYVMAMTGFITWRRRALKAFGSMGYFGRGRRRRMPLPGLPGGPPLPGSAADPSQFPGGLPPGTPGSPAGPPL